MQYTVKFEIEAESPNDALEQVYQLLRLGGSADFIGKKIWDDGTDAFLVDVTSQQEREIL